MHQPHFATAHIEFTSSSSSVPSSRTPASPFHFTPQPPFTFNNRTVSSPLLCFSHSTQRRPSYSEAVTSASWLFPLWLACSFLHALASNVTSVSPFPGLPVSVPPAQATTVPST